MIILCLDQSSSHTGYAVMRDGVLSERGCINIPSSQDLNTRTVNMCADIQELFKKVTPDVMVVEEIYGMPGRYNALKALAIVRGALIVIWHDYATVNKKEANIISIRCSEARKQLGIKGNAKKPEVMDAVNKKFNLRVDNEHEADAIVLAMVARDLLGTPATPKVVAVTQTKKATKIRALRVGRIYKVIGKRKTK